MSDRNDRKTGSIGLLGWLRGDKKADDTGTHRPVGGGRTTSGEQKRANPTQSARVSDVANQGLQSDLLKRHVDRGEIARGGMGSIRKVFDNNLQRTIAMKVIFPEHKTDPLAMQRFAEEAQIMGQLEHPNIVPVYDFGEDQESATRYFTMKLVKGKTLTDMLRDDERNHGTGDFYYKFLSIYSKVCDALAFAHNKRVVHRDLKPDNIMIGSFGEVYLMDWGIARVLGPKAQANGETVEAVQVRKDANIADLDAEGQVIGTFYYMAPEQAHAQLSKVDERTDIFLMGAVLYELLTGIPPYFAPTPIETVMQAQACEVRAPEIMAPERNIPSALSRICMKCMAKDQNDRYQDAMELKRDVENFIRGGAAFPAITFEAGQHLMYEGEIGGQVFIINKGTAQVYKTGKDGRKQGLATLGVGSVVGEASVLSSKPRSASVVAVEDVIATAVTREQLEKELGVDSWMGALVKALANRFIDVDTRLDEAKVRMTAASLMNWLLQYLLLYGRSGPEGQREVGWTHLLTATMAQFKKSEEEVRIGVAELKSFKFDTTRDTIWFAPG